MTRLSRLAVQTLNVRTVAPSRTTACLTAARCSVPFTPSTADRWAGSSLSGPLRTTASTSAPSGWAAPCADSITAIAGAANSRAHKPMSARRMCFLATVGTESLLRPAKTPTRSRAGALDSHFDDNLAIVLATEK